MFLLGFLTGAVIALVFVAALLKPPRGVLPW